MTTTELTDVIQALPHIETDDQERAFIQGLLSQGNHLAIRAKHVNSTGLRQHHQVDLQVSIGEREFVTYATINYCSGSAVINFKDAEREVRLQLPGRYNLSFRNAEMFTERGILHINSKESK